MFTTRARGLYDCKSDSGEDYVVDIESKTCTCRSWFYRKNCRHLAHFGIKNKIGGQSGGE